MYKRVIFIIMIIVLVMAIPLTANAASDDDVNITRPFKEHGAVILLIDDETGAILYANEAAASFYGYSIQELESMNITQINTLSPKETEAEMSAAAKEERNYFVFKHRLANGEMRDVEVFSYPVNYNGGTCLFSIVHDITEKMLLEQHERDVVLGIFIAAGFVIGVLIFLLLLININRKRLKESKIEIENINELRRTFMDADDSIVYLKDENLRYVFVNRAFEKAYQKKSEEVIGIDDFELTEAGFAQLRRKTDSEVITKKTKINDEVTWNGKIYYFTKFPVKMINGVYGVGAHIRDITEDRRREIRLKKMLARNKILVDVINQGSIDKHEQLDYVLNEALKLTESKFGYIYLYDEDSREFAINSWSHDVMDVCRVVNKQTKYRLEDTGIWGEVVRQRKPVIINDFQAPNPLKKGYPEGHVELQRFMSIPVVIDGKIMAVVGLGNKPSDYDELNVYDLTLLMGGVWNAVERREAQEKLILERNKYLQTIVSIGDGVMVVDRQGHIEMLNSVAQRLTGWTQEQAAGQPYRDVFILSHEKEDGETTDPIQAVYETDTIHEMGNNAILISKDGQKYHLEDSAAPIKDENGTTMGVVLVFRDVTEKYEQRRKIEYLSYHDSLTGLYNRRFFEEELTRIDTQRNLPISILMGDVNGLKLTNDIFGHAFGDELLKNVSEVFKNTCRADDIIARWGGDEFVVLLPKTGEDEAKRVMSRIKEGFAKARVKAIKGSISMGSHTKLSEDEDINDGLDRAEANMYISKTVEREKVRGEEIKEIISGLHEAYPEEKGHAERVSELSHVIGKLLRLSNAEAHNLKFGGLLHDIGKITIEPNPTKVAAESEVNDKKKHTTDGYRILHSFDDTMDMAEAALYHHERWDGKGYPKGLKGMAIPLSARVIAVVDNYDKLMYPPSGIVAKKKEEAIRIIEKEAGLSFDPQIVKLFVKMMKAD